MALPSGPLGSMPLTALCSTRSGCFACSTANVVSPGQAVQGELFAEELDKRRKVEEAITRLRQKMKGIKLTKASLIDRDTF